MLNYQRVGQLPGVLLHFLRNLYQHSISPCSVAWLAWWFTHNGRFLNYGYPKPLVFQFIKKSSDLDDNLGYPHLRKCVCMYVYIYTYIYGYWTGDSPIVRLNCQSFAFDAVDPWCSTSLCEAPIEDPPSDTFWWIEGCAFLSLRAPWVPVPDMQSITPGA
jgi:hypothetical protein